MDKQLSVIESVPIKKINLTGMGDAAYQQSSMYRELFETFNFKPFQCLMDKIRNPVISEEAKIATELYAYIETDPKYKDLTPKERLGMIHYIMSNSESLHKVINMHRNGDIPAIFSSNEGGENRVKMIKE